MTHPNDRPRLVPDYPKTRAAEHRAQQRESFAPYLWVALAIAAVCVIVIGLVFVLSDDPARGAADKAAVVADPTATPGVPVPQKPTEYAPPARCTPAGEPTR